MITAEAVKRVVGVGEMAISDKPGDMLITYSLGSCIGVTVYDRVIKLGGLIHCLLPLSRTDPEGARRQPAKYTDVGVIALLQEMYDRGATKENLIVKVAGGSAMQATSDVFETGKRNYTVLRKILWKNSLLIDGEDVGGSKPRTMSLYVNSGLVTVRSNGVEAEL